MKRKGKALASLLLAASLMSNASIVPISANSAGMTEMKKAAKPISASEFIRQYGLKADSLSSALRVMKGYNLYLQNNSECQDEIDQLFSQNSLIPITETAEKARALLEEKSDQLTPEQTAQLQQLIASIDEQLAALQAQEEAVQSGSFEEAEPEPEPAADDDLPQQSGSFEDGPSKEDSVQSGSFEEDTDSSQDDSKTEEDEQPDSSSKEDSSDTDDTEDTETPDEKDPSDEDNEENPDESDQPDQPDPSKPEKPEPSGPTRPGEDEEPDENEQPEKPNPEDPNAPALPQKPSAPEADEKPDADQTEPKEDLPSSNLPSSPSMDQPILAGPASPNVESMTPGSFSPVTTRTITVKSVSKRSNRKITLKNLGTINLLPDFSAKKAWKDSYSPYNTPSLWGQCTWFAWGRFYEMYGFSPRFSGNGYECVSQLLAAHPDKFVRSSKPAAGAVFSSDPAHNHVGIVLEYDEQSDLLTIQEGNLDGISNPNWAEAVEDYRTIKLTSSDIRALYGDVTYAVPKDGTEFVSRPEKAASASRMSIRVKSLHALSTKKIKEKVMGVKIRSYD